MFGRYDVFDLVRSGGDSRVEPCAIGTRRELIAHSNARINRLRSDGCSVRQSVDDSRKRRYR